MRKYRVVRGPWPELIGKVGIDRTPDSDGTAYWLEFPGMILNLDPDQHQDRSWFFPNEVELVA